jgi:hypothetical protein
MAHASMRATLIYQHATAERDARIAGVVTQVYGGGLERCSGTRWARGDRTAKIGSKGWSAAEGLACGFVAEPVTGIEPACPAWEAGALPLSYTGVPGRDPW